MRMTMVGGQFFSGNLFTCELNDISLCLLFKNFSLFIYLFCQAAILLNRCVNHGCIWTGMTWLCLSGIAKNEWNYLIYEKNTTCFYTVTRLCTTSCHSLIPFGNSLTACVLIVKGDLCFFFVKIPESFVVMNHKIILTCAWGMAVLLYFCVALWTSEL